MDGSAGAGVPDRMRRPAIALKIFEVILQRVGDRVRPLGLAIRRTIRLGTFLRLPKRQNGVTIRLGEVVRNDEGTVRGADILGLVDSMADVPADDPAPARWRSCDSRDAARARSADSRVCAPS